MNTHPTLTFEKYGPANLSVMTCAHNVGEVKLNRTTLIFICNVWCHWNNSWEFNLSYFKHLYCYVNIYIGGQKFTVIIFEHKTRSQYIHKLDLFGEVIVGLLKNFGCLCLNLFTSVSCFWSSVSKQACGIAVYLTVCLVRLGKFEPNSLSLRMPVPPCLRLEIMQQDINWTVHFCNSWLHICSDFILTVVSWSWIPRFIAC